jgi:surface antigen
MNLINKKNLFIRLILVTAIVFLGCNKSESRTKYTIGKKIDSLKGVYVYYNGSMNNVSGRNKTIDGYNLGLKYQCVEFVKRYYYEYYSHKMPNSWGPAKDFFRKGVADGDLNKDRNLKQFTNPSKTKPKIGDLIVFTGSIFNSFGHVAIVSKVNDKNLEVIQQNVGKQTRQIYKLKNKNTSWTINDDRILGWLSMN